MQSHPPRGLAALGLALLFTAVLGSGFVPALTPTPVLADTASTMEDQILGLINQSRVNLGLVPLQSQPGLRDLAGYRAGVMASTGVLSHTIAGCLSCELDARGIQYFSYAVCIAWTSSPWGSQAALAIFNWWKNSPGHWSLLMSTTLNYLGVGVAYRSADGTTWSSIVLTESVDQTPPTAEMRFGSHTGTTVSWGWKGDDTPLQTHAAGLKDFDVEYRVDSRTWSLIRSGTTSTSLSLSSRAAGHSYSLRVRSRDGRGNRSYWTAAIRIWVPPARAVAAAASTPSPKPSPSLTASHGPSPSEDGARLTSPVGSDTASVSPAGSIAPAGPARAGAVSLSGSNGGDAPWGAMVLLLIAVALGAGAYRWSRGTPGIEPEEQDARQIDRRQPPRRP